MTHAPRAPRFVALLLAASLALPALAATAGCGSKTADNSSAPTNSAPGPMSQPPMPTQNTPAAKPGLSTKQKVVLLAGAALLFYLYKRDVAQNAKAAQAGGTAPGGQPQLYREDKGPNKGAIYYRKNDASHTVVWLQAPAQGVAVPADQVQQYLPDYNGNNSAYQGQVNTNPQALAGTSVQSAAQYAGVAPGPGGPPGPGM